MAKKSNKAVAAVAPSTEVVVAGPLMEHDTNIVLPAAQKQEEVNVAVTVIKADIARKVFAECYADLEKVPARKVIIARLMAEAGLTKNGAATYLQNMKKKAGYVKTKEVATA